MSSAGRAGCLPHRVAPPAGQASAVSRTRLPALHPDGWRALFCPCQPTGGVGGRGTERVAHSPTVTPGGNDKLGIWIPAA